VAVRLRRVVQEAGDFLRASISSRIGIELETGDCDPCVLADANQLHQVVVNLGLNASQAIGPQEGTITIALDTIEAPSGEGAGASVRCARIRVRDDGRGMERDVMSRIFEPYFTTRDTDEGTGLGLAVVDGILQAHEGSITVRSEAGGGSEFEVRLPILDSASEPPVETPSTRPSGGGERILVLDDEPGLTRLAERRLGSLGYRVTGATEIEEARQAMRTEGAPFDLLITDQNLRHATGLDFVAELRAAGCDLPVILATGTPDEIEPGVARTLRIDRVLAKPYSLDQLAGVVRAVLDRG
jgi:CheY-like chemotaxis protein